MIDSAGGNLKCHFTFSPVKMINRGGDGSGPDNGPAKIESGGDLLLFRPRQNREKSPPLSITSRSAVLGTIALRCGGRRRLASASDRNPDLERCLEY
ncbi:hypothetical protein Voc01_060640 [Virgisporangium ochraceum]|uniref:Uncharacterized protein n=1 Tax=Virgisporangium ochraceum TaxID=65505 RepID=A0A8J3ZVZ6_9ACTN|nr:hypothetical protein Voc01_060640 [Virgisporangium ochraceum]